MTTTQVSKSVNRTALVRQLLAKQPNKPAHEIASKANVHVSIVYHERKLARQASTGAKLPEVATAKKSVNLSARVRELLEKRPDLSNKQIAFRTKASRALIYEVKAQLRRKAAKLPDVIKTSKQVRVPVFADKPKADWNKPIFQERTAEVKPEVKVAGEIKYSERYTKAVDLIADYKLNFNLGSAVAHVLRANTDNRQADIKAAIWYLSNELVSYEK